MPKMRIVFSWAHIISGAEPPPVQNPSYAATLALSNCHCKLHMNVSILKQPNKAIIRDFAGVRRRHLRGIL